MSASLLRKLSHTATELPISRSIIVALRHRGVSPSDSFLASYPKSGNTWMKFMLAQSLGGAAVDFDSVEGLIPDVGTHRGTPQLLPNQGRLIKTHEPYRPSLRRHYRRAIYMVRDGRDVAVSYYFSMLRTGLFDGSFSAFLDRFLAGRIGGFGAWHEHVLSWLEAEPRPLVLRYEDLLDDPVGGLREATTFVGMSLSDERLQEIVEANTADAMRSKESGTRIDRERVRSDINFVRSASSGEWREHFSGDDLSRFVGLAGTALDRSGYDTSLS